MTILNSILSLPSNLWHQSNDGLVKTFYNYHGTSFFHSGNANGEGYMFRNAAQSDILTIKDSGGLIANGITVLGTATLNGSTTCNTTLNVVGNITTSGAPPPRSLASTPRPATALPTL